MTEARFIVTTSREAVKPMNRKLFTVSMPQLVEGKAYLSFRHLVTFSHSQVWMNIEQLTLCFVVRKLRYITNPEFVLAINSFLRTQDLEIISTNLLSAHV